MAPDTDESPFGIRVLQWLCLAIFISTLAGLIPSTLLTYPYSRYALPETHSQRAISIVIGFSFGPLFYGIRRRLAVAWKLGWFLLVVSFSWTLADALESLRKQSDSGGWIALALVIIGFSFVGAYWGRWWYRQKKYFSIAGL